MSKINPQFLKKSINEMFTKRKPRKFPQTVELQINLRDYDPEKRFTGTIKLPHKAHSKLKICVLANAAHIEECQKNQIKYIDVDGLKAFNKDKAKIKKWAKKYDVLLASESVSKEILTLLGNVLVKLNKFPIAVAQGENLIKKIEETKHMIKFAPKKVSCLGTAVGNVESGEDNIRQNVNTAINFLVSLLKKGWQNIDKLYIKTTMSPSYKIFG